jgi:hypothetical protein
MVTVSRVQSSGRVPWIPCVPLLNRIVTPLKTSIHCCCRMFAGGIPNGDAGAGAITQFSPADWVVMDIVVSLSFNS